MSLGLGDLNKKRRPSTKAKTETTTPAKDLTGGKGAWARPQTARPWSDPRSVARSQKQEQTRETVMSVDSLQHDSVFSWADLSSGSFLAKVHAKLSTLEKNVEGLLEGPIKTARRFISRESR
jgi:hypothetical protein